MGWIYLVASADSASHLDHGCGQSPTVKTSALPKLSYCPECETVLFHWHRSGTTCGRCLGLWSPKSISSTAASPARISALQVAAAAWKESEAGWFSRSFASSTNSRRRLSLWKMSRRLGPAVQNEWGKNYPAEGMIVDGELYPLKKLEPRTCATDGSSLLPTPSASSYGTNQGGSAGRVGKKRPGLQTMATQKGGKLCPNFVEWVMGYPPEWTELEPWATLAYRSKRKRRSKD